MPRKNIILNTIIFLAVFGLGVFTFSAQAQAMTRYVDTVPGTDCAGNYSIANRNCSGSDGNSYNTIQKALNTAQISDTVFVRAGEYREHDLNFAASPNQESERITLKAYNNEKVILDPSRPTTELGTFDLADSTDCGPTSHLYCDAADEDVYILKNGTDKTLLPEEAYVILVQTADSTWRVIPKLDQESGGYIWYYFIRYSRNQGDRTWNWWLGIDAISYSDPSGRLLVRYQNSDDVSQKTIKWAGNWNGFKIINKNYLTIDGITIRGCRKGIYIKDSDYITVKNSTLEGGNSAIYTTGDSDNNVYDHNLIHGAWLSDTYTPGSWEGIAKYTETATTDACRHEPASEYCLLSEDNQNKINAAANIYQRLKYELSDENSGDHDSSETRHGINFYGAGSNNVVSNNTAYNLNMHLMITSTSDTEVSGNTFYNSSTSSISPTGNTQRAKIHDNLFYNNNYIIRKGYGYGHSSGLEFYNNRSWNYPYTGKHFYYSQYNPITVPRNWEDDRIYNNTFLGASALVSRSGCSDSSGSTLDSCDYLRNLLVVNNIIATPLVDAGPAWDADEFRCGHNWIGGLGGTNNYTNACESRSSNVKVDHVNNVTNGYIWDRNRLPSDWRVPNNSFGTVDIGVDVTSVFYADDSYKGLTPPDRGVTSRYSAMASPHEMIGAAYDAGAYEYDNGDTTAPTDANGDSHVNIKDIQACIKVITGSDLTYRDQCNALAAPTENTNIKDIQVIIRKIINP